MSPFRRRERREGARRPRLRGLARRTDFSRARALVLGFKGDLLPHDERYWSEVGYTPKWSFESAARKAVADETFVPSARGLAAGPEEAVVQLVSPKLPHGAWPDRP